MTVKPFVDSYACRSKAHCTTCRDPGPEGRSFRDSIREHFYTETRDFPCPFGGEWGKPPEDAPPPPPKPQTPPTTLELAANYAKSTARWVKAGRPVVSEYEFFRRLEICKACEHVRLKPDGAMKMCAKCGCRQKKLEWATEKCPDTPPRWVEDLDKIDHK